MSLFKIVIFVNKAQNIVQSIFQIGAPITYSNLHQKMIWTLGEILDIFTSHFVCTSEVWKFFDTRMCESNVVKLKDWQAEFQRSKLFWKLVDKYLTFWEHKIFVRSVFWFT